MPGLSEGYEVKMKRITPYDVLAVGKAVGIPGYLGSVVKAEDKRDQHGNPIVVHTLKLTHKIKPGLGFRMKHIPLDKPITRTANYSFITVEDEG
jgi:hypothetical protein